MRISLRFASSLLETRMNRRRFVTTLGAAGLAVATQGARAQTAIITDDVGIEADSTKIPVRGGDLPIHFAKPSDKDALPTVLVVHEIYGLNDYIRDVCRRLAKLGYFAAAPDLFFREGAPSEIADIATLRKTIASRVFDAQVMADLDACTAWAAKNGGDPRRLAITGFGWGGRIVWLYATRNTRLAAAVAWYGPLELPRTPLTPLQANDIVERLKAPVLGLYGGHDEQIPPDQVQRMRARLAMADEDSMIVVYPEAGHAFHADYRTTYRPAEATDGWQRMLDWFKRQGM